VRLLFAGLMDRTIFVIKPKKYAERISSLDLLSAFSS